MKKPTCTIIALVLASLSFVLTLGWFLNRHASGDWFEETGFFVNLAVTLASVVLAIAALLRTEPRKLLVAASLLLAAPGVFLCSRILIAIGSFMYHGDT